MTDNTGLNIFQRVNEVRKKVEYLQKQKKVDNKYYVVTHDQVIAEIRPYLIEFGIVIIPTLVASEMHENVIKFTNSTASRYDATYKFTFVNIDDPKDFFDIVIEAHAIDNGDKAPGKAISYAMKYAILKAFSIESGENEESIIGDRISNEQAAESVAAEQVRINGVFGYLKGVAVNEGAKRFEEEWLKTNKPDRDFIGDEQLRKLQGWAKTGHENA